jgi:hypothetical protein
MIKSTIVTTSTRTTPDLVFTSSTTGAPIAGAVTGQTSAITAIILCNTLTPSLTDETINDINVNIYLVPVAAGGVVTSQYMIVNNLNVPAGETIFFSDERIILDSGDEIRVGADSATPGITVTVSAIAV